MRSIFNRRFAEARGRLSAIVATALLMALALAGGRPLLAKEEPATHVVVMENMAFSPSTLRVRVGDRIEFRNRDLVPHTATAKPAGPFDSGIVKPGASWALTTTKAGTFDYTCAFHPMMAGNITVNPR